jgi:formamidopyrimidine-DNA glycosylase
MPELPEVHTTVEGLNKRLPGTRVTDVWSGYDSPFHAGKQNIKNVHYFKNFRRAVVGTQFVRAERRGKNILIHFSNGHTVLIHMKMTGHLLYGRYEQNKKSAEWRAVDAGPLQDPFNRHIRLVFTLSNGKHLAFSDMRKFAKVFAFPSAEIHAVEDLMRIGPEPLGRAFTYDRFFERLMQKPRGQIKTVLMDQSIVAGIGNIYSDEMLWSAGIHPLSKPAAVPARHMRALYRAMRDVLKKGIDFGGDSESDYRNIDGEVGNFQNKHRAYRHTGEPCAKRGCTGIISRTKIGGRSAHFCPIHQKLFT